MEATKEHWNAEIYTDVYDEDRKRVRIPRPELHKTAEDIINIARVVRAEFPDENFDTIFNAIIGTIYKAW